MRKDVLCSYGLYEGLYVRLLLPVHEATEPKEIITYSHVIFVLTVSQRLRVRNNIILYQGLYVPVAKKRPIKVKVSF